MDDDVTAPMRGIWTKSTNKSIFKIKLRLSNRTGKEKKIWKRKMA